MTVHQFPTTVILSVLFMTCHIAVNVTVAREVSTISMVVVKGEVGTISHTMCLLYEYSRFDLIKFGVFLANYSVSNF